MYELQFPKPASVHIEEEVQVNHAELRAQQDALHVEMSQLRKEQNVRKRTTAVDARERRISKAHP